MLTTFYTYRALAEVWNQLLPGLRIAGAYSGSKSELVLEISDGTAIVFGIQGRFRYLFRSDRHGRPRRNVASLFELFSGMEIVSAGIADRDRILIIRLRGQKRIAFVMYGSRPNVLLVDNESVVDAFKSRSALIGSAAPTGRPAVHPPDVAGFQEIASRQTGNIRQVVSRAYPLFDRELVWEVAFRAGLAPEGDFALSTAGSLFRAAADVTREIEERPVSRIYGDEDRVRAFSLIELRHRSDENRERFDSVDTAVRLYCRRSLAQLHLDERLDPARRAFGDAAERARRRVEEVESHLRRPSRADMYEKWGHLLMASGRGSESGFDRLVLEDAFQGGEPVEIPLDAGASVVENAQRYYGRARKARASRQAAEERIAVARSEARLLEEDVAALDNIKTAAELEIFLNERNGRLPPVLRRSGRGRAHAEVPYRHFDIGRSYQVYVGRNSRQNDELTFGFARKHDIWLHARGVPGSHVILRLPARESVPDKWILEWAASIAAYYSKARGSGLVPVAYAARKYVRRAKGSAPGKVIVERERVVLVPPALPGG